MMNASSDVPVGSPWDALQKPTEASEKPFIGDQILAHSISFIHNTMLAQEFSMATAHGNVGCL